MQVKAIAAVAPDRPLERTTIERRDVGPDEVRIAIAFAGSVAHFSVPRTVAAVGELSLAGEVRPVTQAAQRRGEAARLGYQQVIDDRSKALRTALSDVRARTTARRREEEIPAF